MRFKVFVEWCNDRACDGCWDLKSAKACISIIATIRSYPFWKREKVWKQEFEADVLNEIVIPINNKILEMRR